MSNGFVKTNRDLVNYEKWESLSFSEKGMLHELILRAGWKEGEIGKISLSVNSLSKSTGTARNTVTSLLLKLQKKGFLAVAFSKESATVIELDQTELQKISGSSQDLAQNLNKACSKTKQDLAQNLNKACSKTKQENALHHINIEEEKNIEDILPTTSQDIPPYVDEAEEFFATIYDGSAPLEPMDCIPDFEDYQQATEHTQASRDTQAQGTLPSLPPVEKASEKQRKPKEKHLPQ